MFAGEGAVVFDAEVGRFVEVGAELRDAGRALEIEVVACVDAGLPEVAVEVAAVAVLVEQRAQLAKVGAEVFRVDRGILPTFPRMAFAGNERGGAEARLAD